jgi:hypothetical protein
MKWQGTLIDGSSTELTVIVEEPTKDEARARIERENPGVIVGDIRRAGGAPEPLRERKADHTDQLAALLLAARPLEDDKDWKKARGLRGISDAFGAACILLGIAGIGGGVALGEPAIAVLGGATLISGAALGMLIWCVATTAMTQREIAARLAAPTAD